MNMQAYKYIALLLLVWVWGCKETSKEYIYELKDVNIKQDQANKKFSKSDIEYISVVYSDLFNKTISTDEINKLLRLYTASGDKQTIMDMVIRTFLNRPDVVVPSSVDMRADVNRFVEECYKKFYLREPTAYERHYFTEMINKNQQITPAMVYYSFLTSKEYKFY
jgi:hypothetical protein